MRFLLSNSHSAVVLPPVLQLTGYEFDLISFVFCLALSPSVRRLKVDSSLRGFADTLFDGFGSERQAYGIQDRLYAFDSRIAFVANDPIDIFAV